MGAVASSPSCIAVRAGMRQPGWLEMVTPTPSGAITLPDSSGKKQNRRAVEIDLQNRFNGRMNGVLLLPFVPFDFDGG